MKDKKKDAKGADKKDKKKKKEEEQAPSDSLNKVAFSPNLEKCADFLNSALTMIILSTNKISNLEDDLMPFLVKEKTPNFALDENFSWIKNAKENIN